MGLMGQADPKLPHCIRLLPQHPRLRGICIAQGQREQEPLRLTPQLSQTAQDLQASLHQANYEAMTCKNYLNVPPSPPMMI